MEAQQGSWRGLIWRSDPLAKISFIWAMGMVLNLRFHLIDIFNWKQVNIATKDHSSDIHFHRGYNNEGNAVRRLNDADCKNAIEILDWVGIGPARFCQIFEYAEFGDFYSNYDFYREHGYFAFSQT